MISPRRISLLLLIWALLANISSPISQAATTSSFNLTQTPAFPDYKVTFHGVIKPKVKNAVVKIDVKIGNSWSDTRLRTKSTPSGAWKIQARATALAANATYRAKVIIGGKTLTTKTKRIVIEQNPAISTPDELISLSGPGGRIHGTDISRWQHPQDKPIDFVKMYNAGIRFVMIKASDTRDDADALALKYLLMDRDAAQAAGIYTGYYHYTILPNTTNKEFVILDAKAQAQKALWRLTSLGGYTERDLPYALDLEYNCVQVTNGSCVKYAPKSVVTLWAETWLETMYEKTGRKPFLYSYPTFLEQAMVRSEKLRQYPLWKAQYGINPADPIAEPGRKAFGCFVHSWSTANCSSLWQIWQYSSCGIGEKYGVPSPRVDLNVFRGDSASFLQLTRGIWTPAVGDYLPVKEPTTLLITSVSASSTDKPVKIKVEVKRPSGEPVVTGTVAFRRSPVEGGGPVVKVEQSPVRDRAGIWTLSLRNLPAGLTQGYVAFVDQTGTHLENRQDLSINLIQGPEVVVTPTPKPTKPVVPFDSCKNQIKN